MLRARKIPPPETEQLRLARQVQEALLPPPLTALSGLEVVARFCPSRSVGGDFYDYFSLHNRYLCLYLGDVQGKGLEGAMYALLVSGLMRGLRKSDTEPADVIAFLNRRLAFRSLPGKFACLLYAAVDLQTRQLTLANAGLPFPFLLRDGVATRIQVAGIPVGMFDTCDYEQAVVTLRPGDRLLFFTDGLADSLEVLRPRQGDGEKQLAALFAMPASTSATALGDAFLARLCPGRKSARPQDLHDDAAFLLLDVH
ncbi:MAG: PP2C family protein-serine/threonine phosphatase [Candidatus Acidoferrales bacterium]